MERYPTIVTLGAALLGFVVEEMVVSDSAVKDDIKDQCAKSLPFTSTLAVTGH